MEDRVLRVFVIVLVPEDADSAVFDVAVLVETDNPLQCLEIGSLYCVAYRVPVELLARRGDALDRIENDQLRVIGRERIGRRRRL